MSTTQKVIKYLAIALGIYLSVPEYFPAVPTAFETISFLSKTSTSCLFMKVYTFIKHPSN